MEPHFALRPRSSILSAGSRSAPYSRGLMRGGISKALIEMVCKRPWMWQPFLGWEKKRPSCNLAPSSSPLWQGGSDKSSFALAIRKLKRMLGHTERGKKRPITKTLKMLQQKNRPPGHDGANWRLLGHILCPLSQYKFIVLNVWLKLVVSTCFVLKVLAISASKHWGHNFLWEDCCS